MRILRNICLMAFPILIMINLYRFTFFQADFEFRGFAFLHSRISTFNGLDMTFNAIGYLQDMATGFNSIKINNVLDVFTAVGKLVQLVGFAFAIPVVLVANICYDVWWVIESFFIA